MAEPVIASAAEQDYAEALCWYAQRSIQAAEAFEREFARSLEIIASDPQRFPRCDQTHRYYLMRRYPFQVIFRTDGDSVVVIALAHTKRKPRYWADR